LQEAFTDEIRTLQSQVTEGADVLERLMELFGADRSDGPDPGTSEPEDGSDETAPRADFGDGIRLVPRPGGSLHHIEEVRDRARSLFATGLPPLDDEDLEDNRDSHARSA